MPLSAASARCARIVVKFSTATSSNLYGHSINAKTSLPTWLEQKYEKRADVVPRGEGLWSDRSTHLRSPVKTFGRFSVRGPAAWRMDGGTGKNTNTMRTACKDLPYNLWLVWQRPIRRLESPDLSRVGSSTWPPANLLSNACHTRRECGSGDPVGVSPPGSREAPAGRLP